MNDVSRCNIKCENNRYLSCKRYMGNSEQYQGYKIEFDKICNESNSYKYFIQNDIQMQVVNDKVKSGIKEETETNTKEKTENI